MWYSSTTKVPSDVSICTCGVASAPPLAMTGFEPLSNGSHSTPAPNPTSEPPDAAAEAPTAASLPVAALTPDVRSPPLKLSSRARASGCPVPVAASASGLLDVEKSTTTSTNTPTPKATSAGCFIPSKSASAGAKLGLCVRTVNLLQIYSHALRLRRLRRHTQAVAGKQATVRVGTAWLP